MKISSSKLKIANIPFVIVFKHFLKSRSEVDSILVELHSESGLVGYGESLPREYVTGESLESVQKNLKEIVLPKIIGKEFQSVEDVISFLGNFDSFYPELGERDLCVKAAFELALLDLAGKEFERPVYDFFNLPVKEEITYSGIVSAENSMVVKQILKKYKKMGIKQIKLKVGKNLENDIKNVLLTKSIIGEDAQIRLDANEGWDLETAKEYLPKFIELGVVCCEQPMPAESKNDYPQLVQFLDGKMDISIDEGLCSISDAKWMVENKGATVFNLRVSKNGGIVNALKIYNLAKESGIKCQLGAQVGETSILSSAGRILGLLTGDLIFHEGSFGTNLLKYDLTNKPLSFDKFGLGRKSDLTGPGLGIQVGTKLLDKMTQTESTIS
jgi:L-Ala-D/L-Glu epimerase